MYLVTKEIVCESLLSKPAFAHAKCSTLNMWSVFEKTDLELKLGGSG